MQKYKVKKSFAGLGLFAGKNFKKDQRIIQYVGERITVEEADRRGGKYLFELTSKQTIDGKSRKNIARYINHSCRPNCEAILEDKKRVYIHAKKNILKGEELTYDYGTEYKKDYCTPCKCDYCRSKKK